MFNLFKRMHEESSDMSKLHVNIKQASKLLDEAEKYTSNFNGDHNAYVQLKNETQTLAYIIQVAVFDKYEDLFIRTPEDDIGSLQSKLQEYQERVTHVKSRLVNLAEQVGVGMELKSIFAKDEYFEHISSKLSPKAFRNWGFI
jgi:uncharacterized phage infection (PIP) family protein YhgE